MTMEPTPDDGGKTELVEISDGTAIVFGDMPEGLDLVPFSLVDSGTKAAMADAMSITAGAGNLGAQLANGASQARGLVRLAPETQNALRTARPMTDGRFNLGALVGRDGKIAGQIRWSPAGGAQAATLLAAVGPAAAMLAIQVQLAEISSLVRQNIALTADVLRTVRTVEESKLVGLTHAVSSALSEAEHVGSVTDHIWRNIEGKDSDLRASRNYFLQQTSEHLKALRQAMSPKERRDFLEKHGDAILADAHGLLVAQSALFRYQALRAGHLQRDALTDETAAALLTKIVDDARDENKRSLDQANLLIEPILRETSLLAELPGKRTVPFLGERKAAREVAAMAGHLSHAIQKVRGGAAPRPGQALPAPDVVAGPRHASIDHLLRILRWHMNDGESLLAIADTSRGVAPWGAGYLTVTSERILIAGQKEFEREGVISKQVSTADVRYVRFKPGDGDTRPTIDVATRDEDLHLTFGSWAQSRGPRLDVAALANLLRSFMNVPADERHEGPGSTSGALDA